MEEIFDVLTELGEFTGETATQSECHSKGYWHRAVFCLMVNENGEILLQRRSQDKKLWPNRWDVTVGGHVRAGELGRQALVRECKEELGLDISDDDIKFVVSCLSRYDKNGYINNHFDEFYLITKNVDINNVSLQEDEVSEVKFFSQDELIRRIDNNYEEITEKTIAWPLVKKIIENGIINDIIK